MGKGQAVSTLPFSKEFSPREIFIRSHPQRKWLRGVEGAGILPSGCRTAPPPAPETTTLPRLEGLWRTVPHSHRPIPSETCVELVESRAPRLEPSCMPAPTAGPFLQWNRCGSAAVCTSCGPHSATDFTPKEPTQQAKGTYVPHPFAPLLLTQTKQGRKGAAGYLCQGHLRPRAAEEKGERGL